MQAEQVDEQASHEPHFFSHGLLCDSHHGSQRGPVIWVSESHCGEHAQRPLAQKHFHAQAALCASHHDEHCTSTPSSRYRESTKAVSGLSGVPAARFTFGSAGAWRRS